MAVTTVEWLAIGLMGIVTLMTRVAGVGMARYIPRTLFWQRFMNHLPTTLLVAIAVPAFITGDVAVTLAAAATALAAIFGLNLVVCMTIGVGCVALLRLVIS